MVFPSCLNLPQISKTYSFILHPSPVISLQWRHNGRDDIWNHQPHECLLNRLFRCRWKKTSKLRFTGLCEGNSPVTGEFSAQRVSNAENVAIWWRHDVMTCFRTLWNLTWWGNYLWMTRVCCLNMNTIFPGIGIPIVKIRRSWDRLIFLMGIPILVRYWDSLKISCLFTNQGGVSKTLTSS